MGGACHPRVDDRFSAVVALVRAEATCRDGVTLEREDQQDTA